MRSMKFRAMCALILLAMSIAGFGQVKSSVPKFAGTWVLNRAKSEGLTGGLGDAEVRLIVAQDGKQLSAEQKTIIRGREQPSREMNYKLDGSETEAEVVRPLAGTMKLTARWIESRKTLELSSTITGESEGKQVNITTKEQWQLIGKGNALKIERTRHSPQGTQIFKLFFEKQ
ncbi:MAG: hypothetical protein ABIU20_02970 [Blastocatellia bacterium]